MTGFVDEGSAVDAVYLYFNKAFNTVSPSILVLRLGYYSLNGRTATWWVIPYLEACTKNSSAAVSWDLSCSTSQKNGWRALSSSLETTTNWEQPVDMVEGRAAIQRYLDRWKEWTNRDLKKFSKDKYVVLHWKGMALQLGLVGLGSSSEGWFWMLVDSKLSRGQPCAWVTTRASDAWGNRAGMLQPLVWLSDVLQSVAICSAGTEEFWFPSCLVQIEMGILVLLNKGEGLLGIPEEEAKARVAVGCSDGCQPCSGAWPALGPKVE
ncbi:LOW QUALITY PROTEIN: hypothetical protein QYF61_002934, partial [Mycteria americana]